ncbi:MAG: hypothetical protein HY304_00565 [candidate division Zixibacteria bacterium]|nr:hypothetical protein [candidate division Zixibacteria bacterium]
MSPRASKKRTGGPARRRTVRRGRGASPKQPFSLILQPEEMNILRRMARRDKTSVAGVIRQALHTVIFRTHPELAKNAIEKEVESFLDSVRTHLPPGLGQGQRRSRLKNQMVSGLLGRRK